MDMLCCPLCKKTLSSDSNHFFCAGGHCFDRAKEGYVHLLPANQKHSAQPGDTRAMVQSRRAFLAKGYYAPFAAMLAQLASNYLQGVPFPSILDVGCGEGYYTRFLKDAAGEDSFLFGFDISKWAVKYAAKGNKDCIFAVASAFHIPAADTSADLAVNLFAPLDTTELYRVLKPGGYFIYAVPGTRHLMGLKHILYHTPYENEAKDSTYSGFTFLQCIPVKDRICLTEQADIHALFAMTPYYWKTPRDGAERLAACTLLDTEIQFDFLVYQKQVQ